jgi:HD-GYP domain-containing protein (c-di-GMP phosphodiesterase class II)
MGLETTPGGLNADLARLGKALVAQLFVLLKTSHNYSERHAAIDAPVANVGKVIAEIVRLNEEASLMVKGGHLYLGQLRLKQDSSGFEAVRHVMGEMKRHQIGTICFNPALTDEDLRRFVYLFRESDSVPSPDAYAKVLERMQQRMIVNIEVEALDEQLGTGGDRGKLESSRVKDGKLTGRFLYRQAVTAMEDVMVNAAAGQPLRLKDSKRVVQRLIDLLRSEESTLIALAARRSPETDGQNHAANVCILALVMGKRLGMSKFHLCELGMAALFHDIGKTGVPAEILEQAGALSDAERQTLEAHPLYGVKAIMELKGLDVLSCRILTGVFEHHLLADFSGYPRVPYKRLSLFGRIISIVDSYLVLTASRANGRIPSPPDQALRVMLAGAGKAYDQALLKLFINCVGMHGVGSLLLLDTKELAVVVGNNPDPAFWDHPRVKVIADADGREVAGEVLDLSQPGNSRMIIATLDPHRFDLDVDAYLQ